MPSLKKLLPLALACIAFSVSAQDKGGGACRGDAQRFCAQAAGGGGSIMNCLLDHQQEISNACYDALKLRLEQQRGADLGAGAAAESPPAQAAAPVYRSRRPDGRIVYSDVPQLNATLQRQVPLDRVIFAQPLR
jgi:hypothetical protein